MNLEDYLNSNVNNPNEIKNATSFYDKFNKLAVLYNTVTTDKKLLRSQGKYNSRICFIFKNEEHFKSCAKSLQRILPIYGANIWDVLILFSDKDIGNDIQLLFQEIYITNPVVIYIFDNYNLENQLSSISGDTIIGSRFIHVNNIDSIIENNISKEIFDLFEHIITYNY